MELSVKIFIAFLVLALIVYFVEKIQEKKNRQLMSQNTDIKDEIICPKCGSKNIHVEKKGYDASSGFCGAILLGPLGLLCGASDSNKIVKTCLKCGKEF